MMPHFDCLFEEAFKKHQAGHLNEAKEMYTLLLKEQPHNVDVLDLMGILLNQQGLHTLSLPFFEKALEQAPQNPTLHLHQGNTLSALQRFEEALLHFTKALSLNPQYAEAHNNCGNVYLRQENYSKAIEHYEKAISLNPLYYDARCNLALAYCGEDKFKKADEIILQVLIEQPHHPTANHYQHIINDEIAIAQLIDKAIEALREGKTKKAMEYYEQVLSLQPNNAFAGFHLAALKGFQHYTLAPPLFVTNLFNHYAHHYETHLKSTLHYEVPKQLYTLVAPLLYHNKKHILDLGCGTGITGEMFKTHASTLVGVDLAQSMLNEAEKKACYTHLHCDELVNYLQQCDVNFDLILAADVFVYIGDLMDIFMNVNKKLASKGLFAFSIEKSKSVEDYTLLPTARFAHTLQYIKELAHNYNFTFLKAHACTLRTQNEEGIEGFIILLRK